MTARSAKTESGAAAAIAAVATRPRWGCCGGGGAVVARSGRGSAVMSPACAADGMLFVALPAVVRRMPL